jgi:hypothetical protein
MPIAKAVTLSLWSAMQTFPFFAVDVLGPLAGGGDRTVAEEHAVATSFDASALRPRGAHGTGPGSAHASERRARVRDAGSQNRSGGQTPPQLQKKWVMAIFTIGVIVVGETP